MFVKQMLNAGICHRNPHLQWICDTFVGFVFTEISLQGEKYVDKQIETAVNGVKEMKSVMEKSSEAHQKFLDALEKTKEQKEVETCLMILSVSDISAVARMRRCLFRTVKEIGLFCPNRADLIPWKHDATIITANEFYGSHQNRACLLKSLFPFHNRKRCVQLRRWRRNWSVRRRSVMRPWRLCGRSVSPVWRTPALNTTPEHAAVDLDWWDARSEPSHAHIHELTIDYI